jgi:hypothetical protein
VLWTGLVWLIYIQVIECGGHSGTLWPEPTCLLPSLYNTQTKTIPWPLVRKRTIPTERPPLADEIEYQILWIEGCRVVSAADPLRSLISVF